VHLEPIEDLTPDAWNKAIAPYETAMVFHESAWLAFLEATNRGKVLRFRITNGGLVEGYFACCVLTKGPFRILGSPLSAAMSEYMGPIVNEGFDFARFLGALDDTCRSRGIHQLELGSPLCDPVVMSQHGYETQQWNTFRIPLSRSEEAMWNGITGKARNRVRQGVKRGLAVADVSDGAFVDSHYAMLLDVYAHQRLAPQFAIDDFRALFAHVKPAGRLLTLQVRQVETSTVVASGVFVHDDRVVYSLSTAGWIQHRDLYPNELLHWTLMRLAGQRGIASYDIGDRYRTPTSGGTFTEKFNGSSHPIFRFVRHYSALARYSRRLYAALKRVRQQVAGRVRRAQDGGQPARGPRTSPPPSA
jgi:hypothetical protein